MSSAFARFAAVALLTTATGASAVAPATVFLEDLTWTELRDAVRAGKTTIIVPIGGTEQSGPHIALGKHNARARALAEKIARELGNALVAPVVAYAPEGAVDPPAGHMRFPGTITIPDKTFEQVLEYAAPRTRDAGRQRTSAPASQPRPSNGMVVALRVMNSTLASSGRLAM